MPVETVQLVEEWHRRTAGVPAVRAPYTSHLTLLVVVPALIAGWFACRERIVAIAEERSGFTGEYPVIANRPVRGKDDRS